MQLVYRYMENSDESLNTVGLRERKKLETRRAIRQAALDLALESGMKNLTVEAVAEAAEVSPRTFFNYFSCKEDALIADTAEPTAEVCALIMERPLDESPLKSLSVVLTETDPLSLMQASRERSLARQRLVQDNPALLSRQLAQYSAMEQELADTFAGRLGVDRGDDLRPALVAAVAVGLIRVALHRWTAGGTETLSDVLRSVFDLVDEGALTMPPDTR